MDLFTSSWDACLYPAEGASNTGVASLSCIWIVLQNVVNASLVLAAVIAVFLIVFSGVQYITSGGDKEKVDSARKRLTFAIIGLIFIFLSFVIINFIAQFTGVDSKQLTSPPSEQGEFEENLEVNTLKETESHSNTQKSLLETIFEYNPLSSI